MTSPGMYVKFIMLFTHSAHGALHEDVVDSNVALKSRSIILIEAPAKSATYQKTFSIKNEGLFSHYL